MSCGDSGGIQLIRTQRVDGMIPDTPEKIRKIREEEIPRLLFLPEELPTAVDLSGGLPPVGNQEVGDCACWAVGYYHKGYDEGREFGWNLNSTNHQFSPSYIFNQVGRDGGGSSPSEVFETIVNQGCCTLDTFPYTRDFSTKPTEYQKRQAKPYRAKTYGVYLADELDHWRSELASGRLLMIGVNGADLFDMSPPYIVDSCIDFRNHGVCVCGYDTNIEGTGISGFKFVNSWGTRWADNGFAWISEQCVQVGGPYKGVAYYMRDNVTPPSNLRYSAVTNQIIEWDGPNDITYRIYKKSGDTFNAVDSTTETFYIVDSPGEYTVGAEDCEIHD